MERARITSGRLDPAPRSCFFMSGEARAQKGRRQEGRAYLCVPLFQGGCRLRGFGRRGRHDGRGASRTLLPAYYPSMGITELVGFGAPTCSLGTLVGPFVRMRFIRDLSRRLWYVLSFPDMSCGIAVTDLRPDLPLMIAGAAALGFSTGPLAALLDFFGLDSVPETDRDRSRERRAPRIRQHRPRRCSCANALRRSATSIRGTDHGTLGNFKQG